METAMSGMGLILAFCSLSLLRSAGFQTCCAADFQVGPDAPRPAGLETRDTAGLETCATKTVAR
jgi:hypothetical protein